MKVTIYPSTLSGKISARASKSQAHRQLICAALSDKPCTIYCDTVSKDITATANCLSALGSEIKYSDGVFSVTPIKVPKSDALLDCNESGSTLRFLISVASALGANSVFKMCGRLPERPLSPLKEELESHGISFFRPTPDTLKVSGKLSGGDFNLDGSVSSQFISGLLLSLPLFDKPSSVTVTGDIQSADYINMTVDAINSFGGEITCFGNKYTSDGKYVSKKEYRVEGDWSNGAFWLCSGKLPGNNIECDNLNPLSSQGDKEVVNILNSFGNDLVKINAANIPDLVPVLSVTAVALNGKTIIENAERLRIKESDRLSATCELINSLGGKAVETSDGLIITGTGKLNGGCVSSHNDHRIAMSAAVASLICKNPVVLTDAQAVTKSYPDFWDDFVKLGGKIKIEN